MVLVSFAFYIFDIQCIYNYILDSHTLLSNSRVHPRRHDLLLALFLVEFRLLPLVRRLLDPHLQNLTTDRQSYHSFSHDVILILFSRSIRLLFLVEFRLLAAIVAF